MVGELYEKICSMLKGKLTVYPAYQAVPERSVREGIFGVLSPIAFTGGEKPEVVFRLTVMGAEKIEELFEAEKKITAALQAGNLWLKLSWGVCVQSKIRGLEYPLDIKVFLYEPELEPEPELERILRFPLSGEAYFQAESYTLSRKRILQEISSVSGESLWFDGGLRRLVFEGKGRLSSIRDILLLEQAARDKRQFQFAMEGLKLPPMILKSYEVKEISTKGYPLCSLEFEAAFPEGEVTE